jgi:hypothetical protein
MRHCGRVIILLQQFRLFNQINLQRIPAVAVIAQAGDLDQSAPAINPAISCPLFPNRCYTPDWRLLADLQW